MLNRLRLRLTLLAAVLTGTVLVAALSIAFGITRAQYISQRQAAFTGVVAQVQYQWSSYDQLEDAWLTALEQEQGILLQLEENGVPLLFSHRQADARSALFEQVRTLARSEQNLDTGSRPITSLSVRQADFDLPDGRYRCAVRVAASAQNGWRTLLAVQSTVAEGQYLRRLALRFLVLGVAGCAVIAALCWLVAGRAIRPAAQAMEKQQQFLSAAGHELRTPLAVIRANAGAGLTTPDPARVTRYLQAIDAESARMGGLVDDLLLLSAGASARQRLRLQPLEPDTFLLDFAEDMEPMAVQRGRRLTVGVPAGAVPTVQADAYRLRQLLTILLDNALRYEPDGGAVHLTLTAAHGGVRFAVADHGPGVPPAQRRQIFARFYRAPQPEADPETTHYGLGLSVAKELAALHDARLWVEDTSGGGATFCLRLKAR